MIYAAARVAPEKTAFRPVLPLAFRAGLQPEKTMKLTYIEQLRHPNWQRRRLESLQAADWQCTSCGEKDRMLQVHHKRYVKGRMAWEYELSELAVLCEACHAEQHATETLLHRLLAEAPDQKSATEIALGLLAGYLNANYELDVDLEQEAREASGVYVDCGVVAFVAACADWHEVGDALKNLTVDPRGPVVEALIERCKRPAPKQ